jgi:hypothetical protein
LSISPASLDALRALALGFAFAGFLASGYEMLMTRRLGLATLQTGDARALASVPVFVFGAPFVIVRAMVRARPGRPFPVVFAATILAGLWSLACGRVVLDAAGFLAGA